MTFLLQQGFPSATIIDQQFHRWCRRKNHIFPVFSLKNVKFVDDKILMLNSIKLAKITESKNVDGILQSDRQAITDHKINNRKHFDSEISVENINSDNYIPK